MPQGEAGAAPLPAGHRLFEYQVERPLGGGGFGITYLAHDVNLKLPVAIKEYFPRDLVTRGNDQAVLVRADTQALVQYQWGLDRFLDEARALAAFRHANVVRVLRYFSQNGTAYIVMEYVSGQALKQWVPQHAPLDQRDLLDIIHPLLDGLEAVHETGFLHRDIKPDNIYVGSDGEPVLLDFGAARRVSSERDKTNIVSPGFAPIEQYQSHGHQGPWTDIYSLGAVMYWMTTGRQPVEAGARVDHDAMVPATRAGDASVFGKALLHAIDWALEPDETRRPQTVADFREAIQESECTQPAALDEEAASDSPGLRRMGYDQSGPATVPTGMLPENGRKAMLCTILFVELGGYPVGSPDKQLAFKKRFDELLAKALKGVSESTQVDIGSDDRRCIYFMGDPEEALRSAMLLRDLLGQKYGRNLTLRVGLHLGTARVGAELENPINAVGDGFDVARLAMESAQDNQVLASRAYYDLMARFTDNAGAVFSYQCRQEDRLGRAYELYAVAVPPGGAASSQEPPAPPVALAPQAVAQLEAELAELIGPLAGVLVRKGLARAASASDLRLALAMAVPDLSERAAFSLAHEHPGGRGLPLGARPDAVPAELPTRSGPITIPVPDTVVRTRNPDFADSTRQIDIPPKELKIIAATLRKFVGPEAQRLIQKEIPRCDSYKDFVEAIAANIEHLQQREVFLGSLRRALPRR
jgi:serine/threonine protein kinase